MLPGSWCARIDTPLPDRVDKHPAGLYLIGRRSSLSRSAGFSVLNTVARLLGHDDIKSTPWHLIRDYEMHLLRSALAERYAPATANKMLSIVRSVLGQAWKLGMMDTDAYKRAVAVPAIPGTRLPAGRTLEPKEIRRPVRGLRRSRSAGGARRRAARHPARLRAAPHRKRRASTSSTSTGPRRHCASSARATTNASRR